MEYIERPAPQRDSPTRQIQKEQVRPEKTQDRTRFRGATENEKGTAVVRQRKALIQKKYDSRNTRGEGRLQDVRDAARLVSRREVGGMWKNTGPARANSGPDQLPGGNVMCRCRTGTLAAPSPYCKRPAAIRRDAECASRGNQADRSRL